VGILDTSSTVLTTFKADTRQHRQAIKSLKGAEKDRSRALLDGMEKENARLDSQIGKFQKVIGVVAAVTGSYIALKKSWEAYAQRQKSLATGAGKDLGGLRKASRGLVSDTKLLNIESQLLNGAFKITSSEVKDALKGMIALSKQDNELADVTREVTKALVEGNVEGLKKFGISAKETVGTVEAFKLILKELRKEVRKLDGDLDVAGDNTKRSFVKLTNATDNLKIEFGKFAEVVLPVVINALSGLLTMFRAIAVEISGIWDAMKAVGAYEIGGVSLESILMYAPRKGFAFLEDIYSGIEASTAFIDKKMGWDRQTIEGPLKSAGKGIPFKKGQFSAESLDAVTLSNGLVFTYWDKTREGKNIVYTGPGGKIRVPAPRKRGKGKGGGKGSVLDAYDDSLLVTDDDERIKDLIKLATSPISGTPGALGTYKDLAAPRGKFSYGDIDYADAMPLTDKSIWAPSDDEMSRMDKFMGKLGSLNEKTIGINALSDAFNGVAQSFGGAIGAVIDGSDSFVGAMKKMVGESLKGIAIQESVEAFKHAAYAIGSLAWQDYRGAALHAKAAALHGGVALLAGVGARALGVGSQASTPNTAAGAAGAGGGGSRSQTIILGADFETDSARRRSHRLASILQQADMGGSSVVEFG
jgi:hypothetical protein